MRGGGWPILTHRNRNICVYRQKGRRKLNFELNVCLNKYIGLAWLGTRWWCAADANEIMIYPNAVLKFYYEIRILCLFFRFISFFPDCCCHSDTFLMIQFVVEFFPVFLYLAVPFLCISSLGKLQKYIWLRCYGVTSSERTQCPWNSKYHVPQCSREKSKILKICFSHDKRKSVLEVDRIFPTAPSYTTTHQTQYIFPWKKNPRKGKE